MNSFPRIGLIACRVFEEEIALHGGDSPHILETRYLEIGLHDHPDNLRKAVQCEIDAFDGRGDMEAVVLAYALCGRGTAGLRAGLHRLVIPRGHDCMTVFMGSKEKFACQQAACPDSYYYTPGWMKANRCPGPARLESLRAEYSEKFEPDDVEFLIESTKANWAQHGRAVYLDLGTPGPMKRPPKPRPQRRLSDGSMSDCRATPPSSKTCSRAGGIPSGSRSSNPVDCSITRRMKTFSGRDPEGLDLTSAFRGCS